jgi:hypothetical protein
VPARIWLLAGSAALLTVALATLLLAETAAEHDGLHAIGDQAGPEVVASSDLYFALNDMDAQVANVLLVGNASDLGFTRTDAIGIYERRRQRVDRDLRLAAAASTDQATTQTLDTVIDDLGQYEEDAARTLLLDQENPHPPGLPTPVGLAQYRQTTDLLRTQLLPAVSQLTDHHAAALEATYESDHARTQAAASWFLAIGATALVLLVALQVYLGRRFRRLLHPAVAAATVLAAVVVALGAGLLSGEAEHLRSAKKDAFDSILALTRARAVSYAANADESRYLVDPERAGQYQQAFLDKSEELVDLPDTTIGTYDAALATAIAAYRADNAAVGWNGFFGTEFRNITFLGERAAAESTLLRLQTYERDDRQIRALVAAGRLRDAVAFDTSYAPGESNYAFDQYDQALSRLIDINQSAFSQSVSDGFSDLDHTVPEVLAGGVVILLLVGAGIWPRLAEYR